MAKIELSEINQQIYRRFPEIDGVRPKSSVQGNNTLLIYQATVHLADGKTLNRTIRVVIDEYGNILKTSTSR